MDTAAAVLEEEKQNFITRQEALKEKQKKKQRKGEKVATKDQDDDSQKEDEEKLNQDIKAEELKYRIGEEYDNQLEELRKVDYEYEQLLAKAKVKALKLNELQAYDDMENRKMNRAQLKLYLQDDKNAQKESVDLKEINKDWDG